MKFKIAEINDWIVNKLEWHKKAGDIAFTILITYYFTAVCAHIKAAAESGRQSN